MGCAGVGLRPDLLPLSRGDQSSCPMAKARSQPMDPKNRSQSPIDRMEYEKPTSDAARVSKFTPRIWARKVISQKRDDEDEEGHKKYFYNLD